MYGWKDKETARFHFFCRLLRKAFMRSSWSCGCLAYDLDPTPEGGVGAPDTECEVKFIMCARWTTALTAMVSTKVTRWVRLNRYFALCTCAMDAAARGSSSNRSKIESIEHRSDSSTVSFTSEHGPAAILSCSFESSWTNSLGTTSLRVPRNCPDLIHIPPRRAFSKQMGWDTQPTPACYKAYGT